MNLPVLFKTPERRVTFISSTRSLFKYINRKCNRFAILGISIILFLILQILVGCMICIRSNTRPYDSGIVLKDSVHKAFDFNSKSLNIIVKCLSFIIIGVTMVSFFFYQYPVQIYQRFFFTLSILTFIRILFLSSTYFPGPANHCNCVPPKIYKLNFVSIITNLTDLDACNTLFPAFVYMSIACGCFWSAYLHPTISQAICAIVFLISFLEIVSRRAYTFDVLMTGIISVSVFELLQNCFPSDPEENKKQ